MTKNPRLTITISPSLAAQLRKLSELSGNSQSSVIADLLDGSGPIFERLIAVLTAAKAATESMKGKLSNDMLEAQRRVEKHLGVVLEEFGTATQPLLDNFEEIQHRARRGSPQASAAPARTLPAPLPTPLSNRGVRSLTNTTKTIATGLGQPKSKPQKHRAKGRGVGS